MLEPDDVVLDHLQVAVEIAGLEVPEVCLPREADVVLRGRRFHWVDWGGKGTPTLVFLHGFGQTARTWDLVGLALRDRWRCVALDERGHGDSEWAADGDYSAETQAGDVAAFVDHLGLARFVLVGMSMGAINTLHYALGHQDRLAALVAVDAGPWIQAAGTAPIADFRARTREMATIDEYVEAAVRFNPRRDPRLLRLSLLHSLRRTEDGRLTWKTDPGFNVGRPEAGRSREVLQQRVHEIRVPTLVVRGAESDVFSDEDARRFAEALPQGRRVRIEGASHTVQGDNPRALVQAIRDFLVSLGL